MLEIKEKGQVIQFDGWGSTDDIAVEYAKITETIANILMQRCGSEMQIIDIRVKMATAHVAGIERASNRRTDELKQNQ